MRYKAKTCKNCGVTYHPMRQFQAVCGISCAIERSRKERIESARKAREQEYKARKKSIRTHGEWTKVAQRAFNEFVRVRDEGKPCISCGQYKPLTAGHWKTVASRPELRFDLRNCVGQCAGCNQGQVRYKSEGVVSQKFDAGMLERYGQDRIDWINSPHPAKHYTKDELERIARTFRKRARIYKKMRER